MNKVMKVAAVAALFAVCAALVSEAETIRYRASDGVNEVTEVIDENGYVVSSMMTLVGVRHRSPYWRDGKPTHGAYVVTNLTEREVINVVGTNAVRKLNVEKYAERRNVGRGRFVRTCGCGCSSPTNHPPIAMRPCKSPGKCCDGKGDCKCK